MPRIIMKIHGIKGCCQMEWLHRLRCKRSLFLFRSFTFVIISCVLSSLSWKYKSKMVSKMATIVKLNWTVLWFVVIFQNRRNMQKFDQLSCIQAILVIILSTFVEILYCKFIPGICSSPMTNSIQKCIKKSLPHNKCI